MSNSEKSEWPRSAVPNTSALQASIISEAESIPQWINANDVKPKKKWLKMLQIVVPLSAGSVVALIMAINTSNWSAPETGLGPITVVSDELDWQGIMLIEDEWLLADL